MLVIQQLYAEPSLNLKTQRGRPIGPVEIDWSNPLTRGLKFAVFPRNAGEFFDYVSGDIGSVVTGTPTQRTVSTGSAVGNGGGAANLNILFSNVVHDIGTGPCTLVVDYTWNGTTGAWHTPISLPNNSQLGLYTPYNMTNLFLGSDTTASVAYFFDGIPQIVADTPTVWAVSFTGSGSGQDATGWKDGRDTQTISSANQIYSAGTTGVRLFVGQGSEYARGDLSLALVYNRELSAAEHQAIGANPYQIFKPKGEVRVFIPAAGAGAEQIPPGYLTLVGIVPKRIKRIFEKVPAHGT